MYSKNAKIIFKTTIIFQLFLIAFTTSACSKTKKVNEINKLKENTITLVRQDGSEINIIAEMAVTEEQRNRGYMERKNIPEGSGMLFVFENDAIRSFWMKNTPTPLSIAYISSTGKIKDIFDMQSYSITPVVSTCHVKYALEVPQGWFKKNNIKVNDLLKLDFMQK